MSYDVAIWAGPCPVSEASAVEEFERRIEILEAEGELPPASATLRAFVDDLLSVLPPLDESDDPASPWSTGPEPGGISGDFAYLTMTFPGARTALDTVRVVARRHGLVCFDPQLGTVLEGSGTASPPGEAGIADDDGLLTSTYPVIQALETLGVSRRWLERLQARGLLGAGMEPFERIVGLVAAVDVLAVRELSAVHEHIAELVERVTAALQENPSGRGVVIRVAGEVFEVATSEQLGPLPETPVGTAIHQFSLESYVATAGQQLSQRADM